MSVSVSSEEVRTHLRQLGYHNIPDDTFEEFVKDLKKLIKYEQETGGIYYKSLPGVDTSSSSTFSTSSTTLSVDENTPPPTAYVKRGFVRRNLYDESRNNAPVSRHSTETDSSSDHGGTLNSLDSAILRPRRTPTKKKAKVVLEKPKSSFIRPWDMNTAAPKRSDPLALYQKYQAYWQRQGIPAEGVHMRLRWCVREKMIGGIPQPAPMTKISSDWNLNKTRRI